MKSFLHYVAIDIISKYGTDLSDVAVVFPNKRAALFLNEELARCAGKPVWAPTYLTISDLFRKYSALSVGDPIRLVCELYNTYIEITGKDETLDHFYDWGKLLISDFDDIDKNLADAKQVFSNIANIHEYDDVQYLTDEQKDILKSFFSNFTTDHNSKLKELFLSLWNKLSDIYFNYKDRLSKKNIAYEGMLYREIIENSKIDIEYKKYIFVGFNLLQKVEKKLFSYLKSEGVAEFYWDYDRYYMQKLDSGLINEAGKYIASHLKEYGDAIDDSNNIDSSTVRCNFIKSKDISFIKAKTNNIQARYIEEWLSENNRKDDGKRTAIVMCDETLLPSVIHCIPEEVKNINITTGFPLSQTPIASFVLQLLDLRIIGTRKDGGFRFSSIKTILSNPYASYISEESSNLLSKLIDEKNLVPRNEELKIDENTSLLFSSISSNIQILRWLLSILRIIAVKEDSILFQESVFNMYTIINRLASLVESDELTIDNITLQKLIKQLINTTTIPFHGEPAIGVQVMGVLETRNLDFDHLLVLSCNEGNMPKGIRDSSFIPYSIRKAYGLTTVDNKVAIYSYYFNRLLQRAKDITILYNTSTENGNRGEMSRFMLQLMVESNHNIKLLSLHAKQSAASVTCHAIEKSETTIQKLLSYKSISPTAINKYLHCQLQFFYNYILGVKEPDDDIEESLSSRAFGNIFHNSSEEIYKNFSQSGRMITSSIIDELLKKEYVERVVDRMFLREMFGTDETKWRKINYNGMQLISREVIVRYVMRLLEIDKSLTPFNILAVEKDMYGKYTINTCFGERNVKVGGRIDRLDVINDSQTGQRRIRVVDYKTGGTDIKTGIDNVSEIFAPENAGSNKHTDYYLQSMLYSLIVSGDNNCNRESLPVSPALIFIQHAFSDDYDPTILINKEKVTDVEKYATEYTDGLKGLLSEMFDKEHPFVPTDNAKICQYCAYRKLCGK